MACYLIGYDLDKPTQNYAALEKLLKSTGTWWHNLDSTWFVVSDLTITAVRDRLKPALGASDKLLVMAVTGDAWATFGMPDQANQWLKQNVAS